MPADEEVPGVDYCDHYYWDGANEDAYLCCLNPGHAGDHEAYVYGQTPGHDMPSRTWPRRD